MALVLEGKSIGSDRTKKECFKGELLIWRTKNQATDQGMYSTTQRIQFALNRSKLDPGSSSNVGL